MGFPDVTFRTELDQTTRKELELFAGQLQGFLSGAGFKADGSFDQGVADTFEVGALTAETITATDDTTLVDATATTLTPQAFRVSTQSSYTPSAGDASAISDASSPTRTDGTGTPLYSAYRFTPTADRTVNGINVASLTLGAKGHVLWIVNDSTYRLSFESAVVTNARRLYGCNPPVTLQPGGMACFLYDNTNLGWRLVATAGQQAQQAYSTTQVGNVDGGEDDLIALSIPGSTLTVDGQRLLGRFTGTFAANGNEKRVKIKYGATTIVDMGTGHSPNGLKWVAEVSVVRTGAATQNVSGVIWVGGLATAVFTGVTTAAETLTSAITLKATGESVAAVTDDVICKDASASLMR